MRSVVREAVLRGTSGAAEAHEAFRIREKHQDETRAIDVFGTIRGLEIPLHFGRLDGLLGACVRVDSATVGILITTQRSLHMQRFTAAHELGHFVLEHEGSLDREVRMPGDVFERPIPEIEADAFAAEFLMPKWLMVGTAKRCGWWSAECLRDPAVVYQLSLRLAVSYEATCWGLLANDCIDRNDANAIARSTPKELKKSVLRGISLNDSWANVWVLHAGDNNSHLEAGPNDVFVVELEERAAAGFRWDAQVAIQAGFQVLEDGNLFSDRQVGSPAQRRLVFRAPAPGDHEFALNYGRSFARDVNATLRAFVSTWGSVKDDEVFPSTSPGLH